MPRYTIKLPSGEFVHPRHLSGRHHLIWVNKENAVEHERKFNGSGENIGGRFSLRGLYVDYRIEHINGCASLIIEKMDGSNPFVTEDVKKYLVKVVKYVVRNPANFGEGHMDIYECGDTFGYPPLPAENVKANEMLRNGESY